MSLEEFIYDLHFNTDKAKPVEWEADWADAPLSYKLYRHLPVFPLSSNVPLKLEGRQASFKPDLRGIGHFLWYAFGLSQVSQSVLAPGATEETGGSMQYLRRFVPSGGGLYASELYLYLKLDDLPVGIYHYDPAHHRLVLLRHGNYDFYLARTLGNRCDVPACFGFVFVSTLFWKNFFKYHNFSYRLQGLDAGVLIGQLLELTDRFGFESGVCYQFLDRAVNHLLGLSEREESVYAIMPLWCQSVSAWFPAGTTARWNVSARGLCGELPELRHAYYIRSERIREYPLLIKINEASMFESTQLFRQTGAVNDVSSRGRMACPPQTKRWSYDLVSACRRRSSPEHEFKLNPVSQLQLAALLQRSASPSYRTDLDGVGEQAQIRVSLYVCVHGVQDIADGAYRYDAAAHSLRLIRPGDQRRYLQQAMTLGNVNLLQVPLCFHAVGDKNHLQTTMGYRGYRIQQMEAGILAQRLLLAACNDHMGGRPLLGYDSALCDEIYKLSVEGNTSLIQIPVGSYRPRSRLEGGLHG